MLLIMQVTSTDLFNYPFHTQPRGYDREYSGGLSKDVLDFWSWMTKRKGGSIPSWMMTTFYAELYNLIKGVVVDPGERLVVVVKHTPPFCALFCFSFYRAKTAGKQF